MERDIAKFTDGAYEEKTAGYSSYYFEQASYYYLQNWGTFKQVRRKQRKPILITAESAAGLTLN